MGEDLPDFEKRLDRIKWFLWHGNVFKALDILESLDFELDTEVFAEGKDAKEHKKHKLWKAVDEFYEYIQANSSFRLCQLVELFLNLR